MLINICKALPVKSQSVLESFKLDEGNGWLLNSWDALLGLGRLLLLLQVTVRRCRSFLVSVGRHLRWLRVKKSVVRSHPLLNALSAVMLVWATCARILPFTHVVLPVVICLTGTVLVSFFENCPSMAIVWCCLHSLSVCSLVRIIKLINLFWWRGLNNSLDYRPGTFID